MHSGSNKHENNENADRIETELRDKYKISNWDWNFAKNIVTFGKLFLKPSDTIRPESTR